MPHLAPLVEAYWAFDRIAGYDAARVSAQLTRLLSDPRPGYSARSGYELMEKTLGGG